MRSTLNTKMGRRFFKPEEVDLLVKLYPDYIALRRKLPRWSRRAIEDKCQKLGLPPKHGRTPRNFSASQVEAMKIIYTTLPIDQLRATCKAIGLAWRTIERQANKRGWRRPLRFIGVPELDVLRQRCHQMGLYHLDRWLGSNGYFSTGRWGQVIIRVKLIQRAHRELDKRGPAKRMPVVKPVRWAGQD
jgi:hypothetical protein